MGLFDKMREPVFLRESHSAEKQLEKLRELKPQLNEEGQRLIQQDIKCLEYGIAGEQALMYELKNSHMPMYILHDVNFEDGGLTAQIDYMIFTRKMEKGGHLFSHHSESAPPGPAERACGGFL